MKPAVVLWCYLILFFLIKPSNVSAQVSISGRVLSQGSTQPISNVNVFLSNATIGDKTSSDGTFTLKEVIPGKYELVVSIIGFQTYTRAITISTQDLKLPDIILSPKVTELHEVKIKPLSDSQRELYYSWFRAAFLGPSDFAKDCTILNPHILDFSFDKITSKLNASTADFLEIKNEALGYKVKYLLSDFVMKDPTLLDSTMISYHGFVLFEELKGTSSRERQWKKSRQEAYENSLMHFLRSLLNNQSENEGFYAQQLSRYYNPEKPSDSLINTKIKFYSELKPKTSVSRDSLSYWTRKSKLKRILKTLNPYALNRAEIVQNTDQPGLYSLGCDSDALYVTYKKNRHFDPKAAFRNVEDLNNTENTIIHFNSPFAFFDSNGWLTNPESITLSGVWSRGRVAGLLPENYEGSQKHILSDTTNVLTGIYTKLNLFTKTYQPEKVYLHLDKPGGYFSGDTIWYKAYTVIGEHHQLSALSGVLYTELFNQKDSLLARQTLRLISGMAYGDIPLRRSLKPGVYRLRAYTKWMRNSPGTFYDQQIRIGGIVPVLISQATVKNPDVQFFPEGGNLVNGVRSRVAVKSVGVNGFGEDIKGTIEDNEGNIVADFATSHLGMGLFALIPQSGKTYKAIITAPGERAFTADLPKAGEKGYTLALNNSQQDSIYVKIAVNDKLLNGQKSTNFYIIAQNNGKVYYSSQGKLENLVYIARVEKSRFPTGIAQFSLFSQNGEPLAERIAFIRGTDTLKMNISADNTGYTTRQKVKLNLQTKNVSDNPVIGSFSVSVINESRTGMDENAEITMLNKLLLTSELKGYVEQPNYYFTHIDDQKLADLDILMLTQGYRGFEWKKILDNATPPIIYQPENALELSGALKTSSGKPVPNGKVTLMNTTTNLLKDTTTDTDGNFKFSGLDLADTAKLVLRARKEHNGSNVAIYIKQNAYPSADSLPRPDLNSDIISLRKRNDEPDKNYAGYQEQLKLDSLQKSRQLSSVTIRDKMEPKPDAYNHYGAITTYSVDMKRLEAEFFRIEDALIFVVPGMSKGTNGFSYPDPYRKLHKTPVKFVIDGLERNADDLNYFLPKEVDNIRMIPATLLNPPTLILTTKQYAGTDTAKVIKLHVVNIKSKINKKPELTNSGNLNGPGNADQVIMSDQLQNCVNLTDCLVGRAFGVRFVNGKAYSLRGAKAGMRIIVDGVMQDPGASLNDLNTNDIYSIEVLRSGAYLAVYGSNASGGAIVVTMKRGGENTGYITSTAPAGLIIYPFEGYYKAKTFYSPKYNHPKTASEQLDLRSTIYWNPNIITDKDGHARFEYFNNDTKGTYRVVVEGIDDNGNLGRLVYRYKVE